MSISNKTFTCANCGFTYFECIKAQKYPLEQSSILGQAPAPEYGGAPFYILRCVKCGNIVEPNVIKGVRDPLNDPYDNFISELEQTKEAPKPKGIQFERL